MRYTVTESIFDTGAIMTEIPIAVQRGPMSVNFIDSVTTSTSMTDEIQKEIKFENIEHDLEEECCFCDVELLLYIKA